MMGTGKGALCAALVLLAVGCGGREAAWEAEPVKAASTSGAEAAQGDAEAAAAAWAERDSEAKVKEAIAAWEKVVEANPGDHETWTSLARAYYFLADGHIRFHEGDEDAIEEEMLKTFETSVTMAERALMALNESFAAKMRDGENIEDAAKVLGAEGVPALYWRSSSLGKWASAKGFATLLSHKDEIKAIMQHCLDKAPTFLHQAPDRYFGVFYARAPAFAGGDLAKSREHFDKSIAAQPNYFATRVLMAQDLAVKSQDRKLYEKQLNYVIAGDADALEDSAPENRVEQKKAAKLLKQADDFFE